MTRPRWYLTSALVLGGLCALAAPLTSPAQNARTKAAVAETRDEYKVTVINYNPGERATDAARAAAYEREINKLAEGGWELVGSVLSRDNVSTVGGGVTTRDTVSFLAFRRPRR